MTRRSLGFLQLNRRVEAAAGRRLDLEHGVAVGVYCVVLAMTLIAFFNALNLPLVSAPLESLVEKLLGYLPQLIGGGVLLLVAWVVASVARKVAAAALASTTLDDRLSAEAGMQPMSQNLANVLYGLVLLLFLPAVLGALGLGGLLEPVQGMIDTILGMVPNAAAAAALGFVGWFVARLLRDVVSNLLATTGADKLGQRFGLAGTMTLSRLAGLVVFVFVFVPALVLALDTLKLEAVSAPATRMLGSFMDAVPNLFAAGAILAISWFVARFVGNLAASLLGGIGFDALPAKLGLRVGDLEGASTPSRFAGRVIVFFAMLFAAVEAAGVLGFGQVSDLVASLIEFAGQVLLGVVIIGTGLWLSNVAHGAIGGLNRPNARFMAGLARFAILGLVLAMGLRSMGIADDIVNLAFALTLGSVAVAVALSFGLGGREAAGKQMEHWLSRMRGSGSS